MDRADARSAAGDERSTAPQGQGPARARPVQQGERREGASMVDVSRYRCIRASREGRILTVALNHGIVVGQRFS